MKYGFIIDNRKCIGCHACTTACKSEHDIPVGVNRTWVKQVEKGSFPDTRRLFSVMRCNHCSDAPCVDICPTEALYTRDDGIVDFDNDRCIGCKSCMQACPYDALYIDPETHTAAKCNYCAHRIDIGLEPACVNVCPEHAIISGDMDNPESEISQLLARQAVKTRKPEKATQPNLFYIDADDVSLIPNETDTSDITLWGSQSLGVGHFAKEAEKIAYTNADVIAETLKINGSNSVTNHTTSGVPKSIDVLMNKKAKRVYDTPDKGILWGWEVSGYIWTKAIASGAVFIPVLAWLLGIVKLSPALVWSSVITGMLFLLLTGVLLIMDLDQPKRFPYVLLRPQFGSWLVKGGYTITIYGTLLVLTGVALFFNWEVFFSIVFALSAPVAILIAIYTAFLFAQAKGRDFWQSPTLSLHMFIHAIMAGAAIFILLEYFIGIEPSWMSFLKSTLAISIVINLASIILEIVTTHPTKDATLTVQMIVKGRYRKLFWGGIIICGNLIPLILLLTAGESITIAIASILTLMGIYITEHVWVEAPQRISLI